LSGFEPMLFRLKVVQSGRAKPVTNCAKETLTFEWHPR
jgi:hypothetical protein